MEAKGKDFGVVDIFKILARKFIRLAVPYYLMWILLWVL